MPEDLQQAPIIDMTMGSLMQPDAGVPIDVTRDFRDLEDENQNKPNCFGGCSELITKKNWLDELMSSSESGKSISTIAGETATNAVFKKLEFYKGMTLYHLSFTRKPNNRWENSNRDLVDLFNPNEPGGERGHRYEDLKKDMRGAKVGMVFSEPTVERDLNYIHVFVDMGKTIEEYIVQHRGTNEDFSRLYASFMNSSETNGPVDFNVPLIFTHDVPIESFVETIEASYASDENRENAKEYIARLKRDMADLSKIDEYQAEARELAKYLEQQMLSNGISHGILNVLAGDIDSYTNGIESIEDLARKNNSDVINVPEYIQNRTDEMVNEYGENSSYWEKSIQTALDIVDGKRGEFIQLLLSSESKSDSAQSISPEARWIQIAVKQLGISEKEAKSLVLSVATLHEMFEAQQQTFDIVSSMDVAHGAVFFAIEVLTVSDLSELAADQAILELATSREFQIEKGSLETIIQMPQETKDTIFSFFVADQENIALAEVQKLLPDGIDADVLIQTIEFIRHVDEMPPDQKEAAIIQEKEKILHVMASLFDSLTTMLHPEQEAATIHSPRELIPAIAETESVEKFSTALIIWMLLKISGYYANLEFIHTVATKNDKPSLMKFIRKEKPDELVQKEPAPWLLLSIIWYLAMIREQAIQTNQMPPVKKKKKQREVVIFTYAP